MLNAQDEEERRESRTASYYGYLMIVSLVGLPLLFVGLCTWLPGGTNEISESRKYDTVESRKYATLVEVVEMSVTIEQPSGTDRERARRRFTYLYPQLTRRCGGTAMQHSSVAAALWRQVLDSGVDESFLGLVDRYNRMVSRVDLSKRADRSLACRELLAMYTTLRISGYEAEDAADGVIETVNYLSK